MTQYNVVIVDIPQNKRLQANPMYHWLQIFLMHIMIHNQKNITIKNGQRSPIISSYFQDAKTLV